MPKSAIKAFPMILNGSMAGNLTSSVVNELYLDNIGLEFTWTGNPTGTIIVEASNGGVNYYTLTFFPTYSNPAGTASGDLAYINQFPFQWIRVRYTRTSGTGVFNVILTTKEI